MKKLIIPLLILMCYLGLAAQDVKALVVMPNNYGANYQCYYEMFEQLGWDVTTTAVNATVQPCSGYAAPLGCPPVTVDILIQDITDVSLYDCVMLMSSSSYVGNPCIELINSQAALDLVVAADNADLILFTSCSSIRVLAAADVLQGVNVQCPSTWQTEIVDAGANCIGQKIPPVIDGNIVSTMRGQYYAMQNIYAVLTAITALEN
ncbi:MAG: hypothetical protein DRI23_03655 [Candidatus Cloacimonadota bacterium]|nr:MAG: hypothetical protein DRI23_03655 [Candidatus Cloacimonadota bacterium]RLC54386.1 MAG: hypothetical protein DRH79_00630 [Candidatus Cloacimonadota bacterium]